MPAKVSVVDRPRLLRDARIRVTLEVRELDDRLLGVGKRLDCRFDLIGHTGVHDALTRRVGISRGWRRATRHVTCTQSGDAAAMSLGNQPDLQSAESRFEVLRVFPELHEEPRRRRCPPRHAR